MDEGDATSRSNPNLEKVYTEAGNWVRLCNTIIWQMGAAFIAATVTCIGFALGKQQSRSYEVFFGVSSVVSFAIWVYVSALYRTSAAKARSALQEIELMWQIPSRMSVYKLHGDIGYTRFSLFRIQLIALGLLIGFWTVRWFYVL